MAATTLASTVVDITLRRLSEVPSNPAYWSRAEILDLIWEGLLEATLISGHLQVSVDVVLNGNSIQGIGTDVVAVLHARIANVMIQKYSVDELDAANPSWDSAARTVNPSLWAPVGIDQILTHPRSTYVGKTVTLSALQLPAVLAETDVIPLEDEYVDALSCYAFCAARLKEGGVELKDAISDYGLFLGRVAELSDRVGWKAAPDWVRTPRTILALAVARQQVMKR